MSDEAILRELRSLRAQLLPDEVRVALTNAHGLFDRAIDRVERYAGPEPADAG